MLDPTKKYTPSDFEFKKSLGEGSYSFVFLAYLKNSKVSISSSTSSDNNNDGQSESQSTIPYAIKILNKKHIIRHNKVKYVTVEKDVLLKLFHPHIVKLYGTFQDTSSLYFVLEYVNNGDFHRLMKHFGILKIDAVHFFSIQLVNALEYIHSKGIIHRDLKPENILVDEYVKLKITDFGTAKILTGSGGRKEEEDKSSSDSNTQHSSSTRKNSFVGTAEYCSPELLTDREASEQSDVWALGCILFQMCNGKVPFKGTNDYQTFKLITNGQYSYEEECDPDVKPLIDSLLVLDTHKRLGIPGIKSHDFFKTCSWDLTNLLKCPLLKEGEHTFLFPSDEDANHTDEDDEFESSLVGLPDLSFGPVSLNKLNLN